MIGFNHQLTEWCEIHEITFAIKQLREHGQEAVMGRDYVIKECPLGYAVFKKRTQAEEEVREHGGV